MQWRPGADAVARPGRQQQRRRFAAEDVLALSHVAKPFDVRTTAKPDECGLLLAGLTGELFVRIAPDRPEREVDPAGGRGADALTRVADKAPTLPSPRGGG